MLFNNWIRSTNRAPVSNTSLVHRKSLHSHSQSQSQSQSIKVDTRILKQIAKMADHNQNNMIETVINTSRQNWSTFVNPMTTRNKSKHKLIKPKVSTKSHATVKNITKNMIPYTLAWQPPTVLPVVSISKPPIHKRVINSQRYRAYNLNV